MRLCTLSTASSEYFIKTCVFIFSQISRCFHEHSTRFVSTLPPCLAPDLVFFSFSRLLLLLLYYIFFLCLLWILLWLVNSVSFI